MKFRVDEIVKVRTIGEGKECPDYWSDQMRHLNGKILEVFEIDVYGNVVAGQLRSSRFIWDKRDIEKFPLQIGYTACIDHYRVDEGHFAEQNIDINLVLGKRGVIHDIRPEFGLPVAISIDGSQPIWVKINDIELRSVIPNKLIVELDPNECFVAMKRAKRLGKKLYSSDKKLADLREMYGEAEKLRFSGGTVTGRLQSSKPKKQKASNAGTLKWSAPEAGEWKKSMVFIDEMTFPYDDWGKKKVEPQKVEPQIKGIEPSEVMPNDFSLFEDDEFAPMPEEMKAEKEKKDPYAPNNDDDIPF